MGAIFGDKHRLREVITHDLARLHAKTKDKADYDRLYGIIHDNWIDAFPYDWSQNPNIGGGAFAFFGPEQFTYLYNELTNSEGRYIIIGEASSAHHAWVVGALESAARGVYQFLIKASTGAPEGSPECKAFEAYTNDEMEEPFGPIPVEFNRPWFIKLPEDHKANYPDEFGPTGEFARLGVLWEELRLKQQSDTLDFSKVKLKDLKSVIPKGFETLPETGTSPDQPEAEHV
jgi:hypothetical protein